PATLATPSRSPVPQPAPPHPASPPPLSRARATLCRAESTPAPPATIAVSVKASPLPSTTPLQALLRSIRARGELPRASLVLPDPVILLLLHRRCRNAAMPPPVEASVAAAV